MDDKKPEDQTTTPSDNGEAITVKVAVKDGVISEDAVQSQTVSPEVPVSAPATDAPIESPKSEATEVPSVEVKPAPAPEIDLSESASDGQTTDINLDTSAAEIEAQKKAEQEKVAEVATTETTEPSIAPESVIEKAEKEADASPVPASGTIQPSQDESSEKKSESTSTLPTDDKAHPHRNNKKLAAIVTVTVALLLSVVAVYVYMSANSNTAESDKANSQKSASEETVQPATAEDVDQTSQELENAINELDDTADFSDDALSDDSLDL